MPRLKAIRTSSLNSIFASAFLLFSLCSAGQSRAEQAGPDEATLNQLAANPEWKGLLHYYQPLLSTVETSYVDSAEFFLSTEGKISPLTELRASIRVFFTESKETSHPACRFPLRYEWLRRQFKPEAPTIESLCPEVVRYLSQREVHSIRLVFAQAFLENPASMFGHSFLILEEKRRDTPLPLVSETVSFAADSRGENGIALAAKGLSGGYLGRFFFAPYYVRLAQYKDIDARDLWEYELNFTAEEIRRLRLHLLELEQAAFTYFFLDENCSFHLLSLLEVARPGLKLKSQLPFWTIPRDSIAIVSNAPGLIRSTTFRPSRTTLLDFYASELNADEVDAAKQLSLRDDFHLLSGLSNESIGHVLDAAYELRMLHAHPATAELLSERREIKGESLESRVATPSTRPDQGHESSQTSLSFGREDKENFLELSFRLAYHSSNDFQGGFLENADLEFFKPEIRFLPSEDELRLESLLFASLSSKNALSAFISPWSWHISAELSRRAFEDKNILTQELVGHSSAGFGLTRKLGPISITGFLDGDIYAGEDFREKILLGAGPALSLRYQTNPYLGFGADSKLSFWAYEFSRPSYDHSVLLRLSPGKDISLVFESSYVQEFAKSNAWEHRVQLQHSF